MVPGHHLARIAQPKGPLQGGIRAHDSRCVLYFAHKWAHFGPKIGPKIGLFSTSMAWGHRFARQGAARHVSFPIIPFRRSRMAKCPERVFVQHVITMSYLATDLGLQKTTNGIIISYEDNHAAILFWSL